MDNKTAEYTPQRQQADVLEQIELAARRTASQVFTRGDDAQIIMEGFADNIRRILKESYHV